MKVAIFKDDFEIVEPFDTVCAALSYAVSAGLGSEIGPDDEGYDPRRIGWRLKEGYDLRNIP